MTGARPRVALATVLAILALSACTTTKEDPSMTGTSDQTSPAPLPTTQTESMAQLRRHVDPVIEALGTVREVDTDEVLLCGASDGSDGWAATYGVHLVPRSDGEMMVETTLVPRLTSEGWRITRTTNTDVVDWGFHKGYYNVALSVDTAGGNISVGGSGPCLPKKE